MALKQWLKNRASLIFALAILWPGSTVGQSLGEGMAAYDQGRYVEALSIWRPLAEDGNAMAQSLIAMIYELGEGVPRQPKLAVTWYERAARAGHPPSQYQLGRLYRDGVGVDRNAAAAFTWFSLAAEAIPRDSTGNNSATRALADLAGGLDEETLNAARQRLEETRLDVGRR
jgi:TPR repeat protein